MSKKTSINFSRYNELEELAEQVLTEYENRTKSKLSLPIPIEKIGERCLLLKMSPSEKSGLGKGIDGVLLKEERTIVYKRDSYLGRTRFTIAHEICHELISRMDEGLVNRFCELWGDGNKDHTNSRSIEQCLNYLASAILMPRGMVKDACAGLGPINNKVINLLADRFQVSVEAMTYRILDLEKFRMLQRRIDYASLDALILEINEKNNAFMVEAAQDKKVSLTEIRPAEEELRANSKVLQLTIDDLGRLGVGAERRTQQLSQVVDIFDKPIDRLARPYVIELSGPPNAGKNTQCDLLMEYFTNIRHYSVKIYEETYKSCPIDGLEYVEKYIWTVLTTCRNLILDRPTHFDMVILNRGIFDCLAYLELYRQLRQITKKQYDLYSNLLTQPLWLGMIDAVFLLYVSPEVSLLREEKQQRDPVAILASRLDPMITPKPYQNVVNKEMLPRLIECYQVAFEKYKGQFKKIYILDRIDHVDITETAFQLVNKIHDELPAVVGNGRKPVLLNRSDFENKNLTDKNNQPALPGFIELIGENGSKSKAPQV